MAQAPGPGSDEAVVSPRRHREIAVNRRKVAACLAVYKRSDPWHTSRRRDTSGDYGETNQKTQDTS